MKLPRSFYNPFSVVGSIIALGNLLIIIFFFLLSLFFDVGGSYLGIYMYMILPVFLVGGLLMIPIGMIRRSKKLKKEGSENLPKGLRLNLNDKKQWNAFVIFISISFFFLLFTAIGSYQAYHYTESNEFCGTVCHTVMEPEYTAYLDSPHSRVACVECHVGEGADWYVKSKLSGLYQVYSVLAKKYPQPIETPISSLRPARETCEKCHWPEQFYSYSIINEKHFLADTLNTEWNIQLNMKVGSAHSSQGLSEGIHWHINSDISVEYIASSEKRETLPWVRYINKASGDTVIYRDIYEEIDDAAIDTLEIRDMDCMDCHNRPSHHFLPPQEFTDHLIATGDIPAELPEIKMLAMQLFGIQYPSKDSAEYAIQHEVQNFYTMNYPELSMQKPELLDKSKAGLLKGYSKNFFSHMKANWDVYPHHIGHIEFNGCFRCHNGNHISENGEIISRDCNLCHTIVGQGTPDNFSRVTLDSSLIFEHPVDIDELWKDYACAECHRYLY